MKKYGERVHGKRKLIRKAAGWITNLLVLAQLVLYLLAALPVLADTVTWKAPASGYWDGATNWDTGTIPGSISADDVGVGLAGTYTITVRTGNNYAINSFTDTIATSTLALTGGALSVTGSYANAGITTISGGTLTLNNTSSSTSLTLSSGILRGTGTLTLSGTSTWSGGTMQDTGATVVSSTGILGITTAAAHTLGASGYGNRTLTNNGIVNWSGAGALNVTYGSAITNNLAFNDQNTAAAAMGATGTGTFNNAGTYSKVGNGTTAGTTTIAAQFNNTGLVDVQRGTLVLSGGGTHTGGTFQGAGNLTLSGGHTFNGTAVTAGTATFSGGANTFDATSSLAATNITFSGGTNTVGGAYTATGTTSVTGGTVTFPTFAPIPTFNNLYVSGTSTTATLNNTTSGLANVTIVSYGTLYLNTDTSITTLTLGNNTGGSLGGTGNITVLGASTMYGDYGAKLLAGGSITFNGNLTISQGYHNDTYLYRTLNLYGTTTHAANYALRVYDGGMINNYGIWQDQLTSGEIRNYGTTGAFNNYGTYQKTGAGTTTISVPFNNTFVDATKPGKVEVQAGTLAFTGGGAANSGSSFFGATGTTLAFANYTLDANSPIDAYNVTFSGGTMNVIGDYKALGTTSITGGTVTFPISAPIPTLNNLYVSGSSTTATFDNTVNGFANVTIVSYGKLYLNTDATIAALTLGNNTGGTLGGTGNITVSGASTIYGNGGSGAILPAGGTITFNGNLAIAEGYTNDVYLYRTLNLYGTTTHTGGYSLRVNSGGVVNNYGLWQDQKTSGAITYSGTAGTFNNCGTYQKTGAGTTTISVPFNNTFVDATKPGKVEVQAGTLAFTGGGAANSGSSFFGATGTTLQFANYTFDPSLTINASNLVFSAGVMAIPNISATNVTFSGGTNTVNGSYAATGTTSVTAGTVSFPTTAPIPTLNNLSVSGGSITFAGATSGPTSVSIASGGAVSLAADTTIAVFGITNGGTIGGLGNITVSGPTASYIGMSSSSDSHAWIGSGGSLTFNGPLTISKGYGANLYLGRVLNLNDTTTYASTTGYFYVNSPGGINNNGLWLDQIAATRTGQISTNATAGTFNNYGTYQKTGAGTTTISIPFTNTGTLTLQAGTLNLSGGLTGGPVSTVNIDGGALSYSGATLNTGTFTVGYTSGRTGTYTLATGKAINTTYETIGVSGIGTLTQTGATSVNTVADTLTIAANPGSTGTYLLQGGTLSAPNVVVNEGGTFTQSAGTTFTFRDITQTGGAVTFPGNLSLATASGSIGSYTLGGTGILTVPGNIVGGAGTSTFTIDGCTLNGANSITVTNFNMGSAVGSNGSFILDTRTISAVNETIGISGTGMLTQTGGSNTIASTLTLGVNPGSSGTYMLQGGTLSVPTIQVNEGGSFTHSGGNLLFAAINQANGSTSFTLPLVLNNQTYTMGNGTASFAGLTVGNTATGTFTQSGGASTITGDLFLAVNPGSTGAFTLSGGSMAVTGNIVKGSGTSTVLIEGGTLSFGTSASMDSLTIGSQAGSNGSFALGTGKTLSTPIEIIGSSGRGSFTQTGGINAPGVITLADLTGSQGSYTMSGGSLTTGNPLIVGNSGSASFTQTGGTTTITNNLLLAANPGSTGTYLLSGGTLDVRGAITKGAGTSTFTLKGGSLTGWTSIDVGTFNVGYGGSNVAFAQGGKPITVDTLNLGASGSPRPLPYSVNFSQDGTVNVAGMLKIGANAGSVSIYTLSSGSLSASSETIGAGSEGRFIQTGGTNTTGAVTLGSASSPGTYSLQGGALSASHLTINNRGIFNYSGGTLSLSDSISIVSNGTMNLSGSGVRTVGGELLNNAAGTVNIDHTTAIFNNKVTSYGVFHVTQSTVTFAGGRDIYGPYITDPTITYDTTLTVKSNGYIQAAMGDVFMMKGDFMNNSIKFQDWDTSKAEIGFTGSGMHHIQPGDRNAFAWGSFTIDADNQVSIDSGSLYVTSISGILLDQTTHTITNLYGDANTHLYYVQSTGLDLTGFSLTGGGLVDTWSGTPAQTPIPGAVWLFAGGLAVVGMIRRKRQL
jgi:hypothetical protein